MTPVEFQHLTGVSRETLARLQCYADLLVRWNNVVNLVSRASLTDLWRRHMLDSAQLLPVLPRVREIRRRVVLDLGSGAGFPGMVLSILGAGDVHLTEPDQRKILFLREVAREAGSDAHIHGVRAEKLPRFQVDVVTSRALAPLGRLLGYGAPFLNPDEVGDGRSAAQAVFLKGQRVEEELTAARKLWKMRVQRFPSRTDPTGTILLIGVHGRATAIS